MNESWHTHEWVMSRSCGLFFWVIACAFEGLCRASLWCHICAWVMAHIWMSHVAHMNESWHTHEWVMSHSGSLLVSHGLHISGLIQCLIIMAHMCMSSVTHMSEWWHTHEWVTSRSWCFFFGVIHIQFTPIHIHVHIHIHIHIHIQLIHIHIHIRLQCIHILINIHIHVHFHAHTRTRTPTPTGTVTFPGAPAKLFTTAVCVRVCVWIVRIYVCVCVQAQSSFLGHQSSCLLQPTLRFVSCFIFGTCESIRRALFRTPKHVKRPKRVDLSRLVYLI